MKYTLLISFLIIISTTICCQNRQIDSKVILGKITKHSVDKAYLGMKISALKKAYANCSFSQEPLFKYGLDDEEPGILIKENGEPILFIWTMQGDSVIAGIFCLTSKFETENKIRVGLSVKDLLVKYPNCSLSRDCLEMAVETTKLKDIGVTIEFVTTEKNRVGKYTQDDCEEETKILDTNRKIDRIEI